MSVVHGSASPGSRRGSKDSGSLADTGASASGMDGRSPRDDASDSESLDAQGERTGTKGFRTDKTTWTSSSFNPQGASVVGRSFGALPLGV